MNTLRFCQSSPLCTVSVVVGVDAELDESFVDDVYQTEVKIVSRWRNVSSNKKHNWLDNVDEILRPLGNGTSLVMIGLVAERANSLALYFICMTLSAVMSLRDQWRSRQLRDTVQKLFTLLSGVTCPSDATQRVDYVKSLTWRLTDYQRCLDFFSSVQG